ncbi:MAG: hypothetical protein J6T87_10800 [Bacteroidales bacterium]|nr:hypothetical protein [Bacteroidales bacterium]
MKKIVTLIITVLCAATLFAQSPEKFTYQAVVRNASNVLVVNAPVGVRVSILQGGINGNLAYMETQTAVTNANGLITLQIGGGSVQQGVFADIDWANGPFFLKTETDPNGGSDYSVTSVQQLLSVPYALYSKEAGNGFSGDYNDLTNLPQIPQNVSELTNDAGYITMDSVPAIPTNVSAFNNDAGYLTGYTETDPQFNAWDKDYNDLINTPTIPTVPENVSTFTNDAGYITTAQIPAQVNADWNATTGVAEILNKPTLFSGNYNDLTNKPTLFSGSYNDLTDKPTLFSGDYNDLTNKPTLFSGNYNDLTNKPVLFSGSYYDLSDRPVLFDGDYNSLSNRPNLATVATSGSYNDLSEKPTIPTVPPNVGAFTNDAHYITEAQLNALLASMNSAIDSLRDRIEELENGTSPVNPDTTNPVNPDPTPSGTAVTADGLPCPGTPKVYDLQGNEYNTVVIGQQCWMKENLRSTQYSDGSFIERKPNTTQSSNNRYCYYPGGSASNVDDYGLLYNWPAVMGGDVPNPNLNWVRGICPEGWHVPNNGEWTQFTNYVKSKADNICDENTPQSIAKALAATTNWTSNSIHCAVGDYPLNNNNTGFSVLPAGDLSGNGGNMGTIAYIWTCTEASSSSAMAAQLTSTASTVALSSADKSSGYSVRCVRDTAVAVSGTQMVVTTAVGNITTNSASFGGAVNSGDGASVVEKGVCWSQMPNPTIAGDHVSNGGGTGSFSVSMTGLQPNTTYYVRAYAKMSVAGNAGTVTATTYGNTQTFTTQPDASGCGTAIIYDIDNHAYNTVKIGTQCWMKENLRTTRYADGTPVGYYTTQGSDDYGFLYNWNNVMHEASSSSTIPSGVRGVCPIGWHVPSNAEWSDLINYVGSQANWICDGSQANVARALAANTGWNQSSTECAPGNQLTSNNLTGFSALPAGIYESGGVYEIGNVAYFWSATWRNSSSAYYWGLSRNSTSMYSGYWQPSLGYSVRCLRD